MSGYYVSDEFRTNNLSLTPGGSTVIVELSNGETKVYDKVKNPTAYINAILNKNPPPMPRNEKCSYSIAISKSCASFLRRQLSQARRIPTRLL